MTESTAPAAPSATAWVEETLARLTTDQKLGQLLHPFVRSQHTPEQIAEQFGGVEPGGVFVFPGSVEEIARTTEAVQGLASVPVVISSDLENGAGRMVNDATRFPDLMAIAAADDDELAYAMGRAAAVEGRACGIHWSFGPVVDINSNFRNPITNTRGLGDDPHRIAHLAGRLIAGMQDHGLAATAKHFPGDGFDDRDQHICTSVNPLSMEEWRRLSGRMFEQAIAGGVWSIMIGHIALPAWDPGPTPNVRDTAPPATLSRRLTTDLLRGELGFEGMIVSDAMGMGGVTSWGPRSEIVPGCVEAGCDMVLFAPIQRDFAHLKRALEEGRLSEERLDDAVRRVLAFKRRLKLDRKAGPIACSEDDRALFAKAARQLAERAPTLVRDRLGALPLDLSAGKRVLSIHFRADPLYHVDGIDDLLRARGLDVTVVKDTDATLEWLDDEKLDAFDAILVHVVFGPSWNTNRIRPTGNFMRYLTDHARHHCPRTVHISYGSPYLLRDWPRLGALLNAYSPDPLTQASVVRILAGEARAVGHSPVGV